MRSELSACHHDGKIIHLAHKKWGEKASLLFRFSMYITIYHSFWVVRTVSQVDVMNGFLCAHASWFTQQMCIQRIWVLEKYTYICPVIFHHSDRCWMAAYLYKKHLRIYYTNICTYVGVAIWVILFYSASSNLSSITRRTGIMNCYPWNIIFFFWKIGWASGHDLGPFTHMYVAVKKNLHMMWICNKLSAVA